MTLSEKHASTHNYHIWHQRFGQKEFLTLRQCRDCGARISDLGNKRTSTPEARQACAKKYA